MNHNCKHYIRWRSRPSQQTSGQPRVLFQRACLRSEVCLDGLESADQTPRMRSKISAATVGRAGVWVWETSCGCMYVCVCVCVCVRVCLSSWSMCLCVRVCTYVCVDGWMEAEYSVHQAKKIFCSVRRLTKVPQAGPGHSPPRSSTTSQHAKHATWPQALLKGREGFLPHRIQSLRLDAPPAVSGPPATPVNHTR